MWQEAMQLSGGGGTVNYKVDKTLNAGKDVQTTVHLGFKPTYVTVIKNNGSVDVVATKTVFTDGTENMEISRLNGSGASLDGMVTITITDDGFIYKQTFTGTSNNILYFALDKEFEN